MAKAKNDARQQVVQLSLLPEDKHKDGNHSPLLLSINCEETLISVCYNNFVKLFSARSLDRKVESFRLT